MKPIKVILAFTPDLSASTVRRVMTERELSTAFDRALITEHQAVHLRPSRAALVCPASAQRIAFQMAVSTGEVSL